MERSKAMTNAIYTDLYRPVTKDKFFATVGPMNVHPRVERDACFWETPNRTLVGKTTPGYLGTGPKAYFLVQ